MDETADRKTFDPTGFHIDPTLRGRPLASPWRRGAALLADLVIIAALTQTGSITFSILVALATSWAIARGGVPGWRRWVRGLGAAFVGFIVFLGVLTVTWDGPVYYSNQADWASFGEAMSTGDSEAQQRAVEILEAQLESDSTEEQIAEALLALGVEMDPTDDEETEAPLQVEEVIALLSTQVQELQGDGAQQGSVEEVRKALTPWVAGTELDAARARRLQLLRELGDLTSENQRLQGQIDNPSLKYLFQAVASDLGLTLGWGGLYFTLFLAFAEGRTPGKRLFRLRVARLDGSPVTLWSSFERFAGYAAGVATGFLGFLQVFWDRNGRTVQDALGGTVVLDDRDSKK